jgi:hypothetical protein
MYCPQCGSSISDIAPQCHCGYGLPSITPETTGPRQNGSLTIDFAVQPLAGVGSLVGQSLQLLFRYFRPIAAITLIVFAPVEIAKNLLLYRAGVQDNLALTIRLDMTLGAIFSSLVAPALIYALVGAMRTGSVPGLGECFRWGRRQWWRTFANRWLAGLAILGGLILLVIPGVIFAVWFCLVDPIVAIEGDKQRKVLTRSRDLTRNHRWTIFGAGCLCFLLMLVVSLLIGIPLALVDHWFVTATIDCLSDVASSFFTVLMLVVYLRLAVGRNKSAQVAGASREQLE